MVQKTPIKNSIWSHEVEQSDLNLSCGTESCDNKGRVQKGSRLPRQPEQLKCPLAVNH